MFESCNLFKIGRGGAYSLLYSITGWKNVSDKMAGCNWVGAI